MLFDLLGTCNIISCSTYTYTGCRSVITCRNQTRKNPQAQMRIVYLTVPTTSSKVRKSIFLTCSDIWSLQNQDEGNCDEFENSGIQKPPFRFPHWGPPWPLHGRAPRTVHKTRATSAYLKITSLLQSQMCSICSKQP